MSNTTISPNMNLIVPVVGTDPGPDWANNVNASLGIIDQHNHSPGSGVPITPAGLNINSDLTFQNNNLISARAVIFSPQVSPLSLASDIGCIYESGVDLWYNDAAGNQIQITANGSVTGASGTITGLPSGTASASFAGGTFTFESATATPATMAVGPLIIGTSTASSKTVTLTPASGQASDYTLTLPAAAPVANQILQSDVSGNLTWSTNTVGRLPIGSVIATFPNLSGAYTTANTTAADAAGFVLCVGQTISDVTSPMNGAVVPAINNSVFLMGSTTAGSTGGNNTTTLTSTQLPAHTHGAGTFATSIGVTGGTASLTGTTTFASSTHTHNFAHDHQWLLTDFTGSNSSYGLTTSSASTTSITSANVDFLNRLSLASTGTNAAGLSNFTAGAQNWYTTGALAAPSGSGSTAVTAAPSATGTVAISSTAASATGSNTVTGTSASTGSGTGYDSRPKYISAVYLMRIV